MNPIEIQANEEGRKAIVALCDVALKAGGLQNLNHINQILMSVRPLPPQEKQEKKEEKAIVKE